MEVIYLDDQSQVQSTEAYAMAMGFFDGVHVGHQELLKTTSLYAREHGIKSAVFTFSPHPDEVIKGMEDRKYITLLHEKLDRIAACGIDTTFVMKFDWSFASLDPYEFIDRYVFQMNVHHVVVGFDFTFGFKAKGNAQLLEEVALATSRYTVSIIPKKTVDHVKIGSTETKALVEDGEVDRVIDFLGEYYTVGAQLYHDMPCKYHVHLDEKYILPNTGVYFVYVSVNGRKVYGELTITKNHRLLHLERSLEKVDIIDSCLLTFVQKVKVKEEVYA